MRRLLIAIFALCLATACSSVVEEPGFSVKESTNQPVQYIDDFDNVKYRLVMKTSADRDIKLDREYNAIKDIIGDRSRSFCIYAGDLYVICPEGKKIFVYKDMDENEESEILYEKLYAVRDFCIINNEMYFLVKTLDEKMINPSYYIVKLDMYGKVLDKISVPDAHVPKDDDLPDNRYAVIDFRGIGNGLLILYSNGDAYIYEGGAWLVAQEYTNVRIDENGKPIDVAEIDWVEAQLNSIPYLPVYNIKDGTYYSVGFRNDIIVTPLNDPVYRIYLCSDNQNYNAIPKMKVVFTADNRIFQSYYDGYYRNYYIFEVLAGASKKK
ncbi:MAG: hypothetical protein KAH14_02025 [Clostridiales bacterium]|nr:hypothetical protein [Clostridiales bacterium]